MINTRYPAAILAMLGGVIQGGNGGWVPFPSEPSQSVRCCSPSSSYISGAAFFAAVAGLLYVTSLYLQEGHHLSPLEDAGTMAPMSVGIIVASVRGLIAGLGRRLVAIGLALVGAGTTRRTGVREGEA